MGVPALIADIGGTNVRFALVQPGRDPWAVERFRCADFSGPAEAAQAYFARLAARGEECVPRRAAFAVACPVTDDRVHLTNLAWAFSIADTRARLGLERLEVVNDFTAVALSVPCLAPGDVVAIGGGAAVDGAPVGILGPGTGLGVSALVTGTTGAPTVLATEGGHVTMAATDAREAAVLAWLSRHFGHVSAERVLSGPGLVNLHRALAALAGQSPVAETPEEISARALDGSCPLCRETLALFFALLGTMAGNLALTLGARGGVYLAGGILPGLRDALVASAFRHRFEAKGRFQSYLAPIPVRLIVHPQPAFAGLSALATAE
jgi:glucokinase